MPLLKPNRGGRPSHAISSKGGRKGGLWRLLSCTEGLPDIDEKDEIDSRSWRRVVRDERRRSDRLRPAEGLAKSGDSNRRRRRRCSGSVNERTAAMDNASNSGRHGRRRNQRHQNRRCSRHSWTSCGGDAARRKPLLPESTRGVSRGGGGVSASRRRHKRLVVAMLEDGDDEEAAVAAPRAGGHGETIRLRATRDERKIRKILHQLSETMDASDDHLPEFASLDIPNSIGQKSPKSHIAGATADTIRTSNTMSLQPSPLGRQLPVLPSQFLAPPVPPLRWSQQQPPPLPKRLSGPTTPIVSVDPATITPSEELLHGYHRYQQPQPQPPASGSGAVAAQQALNCPMMAQQLDKRSQYNQMIYLVSQYPPPPTQETAIRSNGRRGYRLFRRVFSAADNYYAVPFPPLETIKLNKDDDQWEDLEIYVASHKGMVAVKPKQFNKKSTSQLKDNRRLTTTAASTGPSAVVSKTSSGIPRPTASGSEQAAKRPTPQSQPQTPRLQKPTAFTLSASKTVSAGDGALVKPSLQPQKRDLPVRQQQQQQQQQQSKKPQQATKQAAGSANRAVAPSSVPKAHFGYKPQPSSQQAKRADPIPSSKLPAQGDARASQLPVGRWEPTASGLRSNLRCAKPDVKLPANLH